MPVRAQKPASWFTASEWLGKDMDEYKRLHGLILLIKADFDRMAVSDGTATCHLKDKAFVYESRKARNSLGPLLDSVVQAMRKCDDVEANIYNKDYSLLDNIQQYFFTVLKALRKLKADINQDTLNLLNDCIILSSNDEWSRTVYGKAIAVRSRKNRPGKDELERSVIDRLIDGPYGLMESFPADGDGYIGQLGTLARTSMRSVKHFKIPHFLPITLDSIHDSRRSSPITRAIITRIHFKGKDRDAKSSLKHAYRLDFEHVDGKYKSVNADFISDMEVGQIFEFESKVLEGQTGIAITSSDDREWLDYIKDNFGLLLWVYMVNHPGYAGANFSLDDTKKLVYDTLGDPSRSFSLSEADELLSSFNFDGSAANAPLQELVAAASIPRSGCGMGTAKYIGTLNAPRGFEEVVEQVGLNVHHIRSGTGEWVNDFIENIMEAHRSVEFGVRIALSGPFAVPYRTHKHYHEAIEVAGDQNADISIQQALNLSQVGSLKYFCR
ncbi:MAG: hypothetical protein Q9182_001134 [Xanthomendoza sp. 2 TL-2023]